MWELIRANQRRSHLLFSAVALLLLATGLAFGEVVLQEPIWGLFAALGLWLVLTELAFRTGDKVLLAISGARRIEKKDHPVLFNLVEEMTVAHGLAKAPEIYILDETAPNAFATGTKPEKSAVVVTSGLLERLTRDELQGVVAHELAHIKHQDVVYLTQMAVMVGSVVLLAELARRVLFFGRGMRRRTTPKSRGPAPIYLLAIILILIAPLVSRLMYFALSRRREYLADAAAAVATRFPEGLASALEKIQQHWTPMVRANPVTAPMFIINPLRRAAKAVETLFRTHPPTHERIRILRSFGGKVSYADYDRAFRQVTGQPVGLVPKAALGMPEAPVRPSVQDPRTPQERLRQSTDILWRLAGYSFILCPCGTTLKVPPVYRGQKLPCPQCGTLHKVVKP